MMFMYDIVCLKIWSWMQERQKVGICFIIFQHQNFRFKIKNKNKNLLPAIPDHKISEKRTLSFFFTWPQLSDSLVAAVPISTISVCRGAWHFNRQLRYFRSLHRFAVRSSSAHEGKIIIFERFQCSLTKTIQLN